jgi:hypothetical protein
LFGSMACVEERTHRLRNGVMPLRRVAEVSRTELCLSCGVAQKRGRCDDLSLAACEGTERKESAKRQPW